MYQCTAAVPRSWAWRCPGWSCVSARRCRVWWAVPCGCWRKTTPAAFVTPASHCPTYCRACPPPPWSHEHARPHWQTERQLMQPGLIYFYTCLLLLCEDKDFIEKDREGQVNSLYALHSDMDCVPLLWDTQTHTHTDRWCLTWVWSTGRWPICWGLPALFDHDWSWQGRSGLVHHVCPVHLETTDS